MNTADHSLTVILTHLSTFAIATIPSSPANGNSSPIITNFFAIGVGLSLLAIAVISVVAIVDYKHQRNPKLFPDLKARVKQKVARLKKAKRN